MSICNDILEYLEENEWIDTMVALGMKLEKVRKDGR